MNLLKPIGLCIRNGQTLQHVNYTIESLFFRIQHTLTDIIYEHLSGSLRTKPFNDHQENVRTQDTVNFLSMYFCDNLTGKVVSSVAETVSCSVQVLGLSGPTPITFP